MTDRGPAVSTAASARNGSRWPAGLTGALGVVWLAAAAVLAGLDWSVLRAGHPAQLVALGVAALVGLALIVLAVRLRRRSAPRGRGRRALRVGATGLGLVITVAVIGALVYLRPFGASRAGIAALAGGDGVRVVDAATTITVRPERGTATTGLVFQPGARVDPRAYLPILEPVSRAGVLVVIVKQPFDIGFVATGAPEAIIKAHPEITRWAVGGHSLGGVAASSYAGTHPDTVRGLVLWASYPLDSLADSPLRVASISGTNDGLARPAAIEASKAKLPASTAFTAVPGAVHAFFGDYGAQPGDGEPATTRSDAQRQIAAATVALLGSL